VAKKRAVKPSTYFDKCGLVAHEWSEEFGYFLLNVIIKKYRRGTTIFEKAVMKKE